MVETREAEVVAKDPTTSESRAAEKQLVAKARQGDSRAVRGLVDAHKDRLFAFIRRMVRHHHDAEEVCQETFLKAFSSIDSFSSEYRFSTWLFTIGYRVCLNTMRRKRAVTGDLDFGRLAGEGDDPGQASLESEEAGELKDLIWSAVDELSDAQRATVLLFYRHEQSCNEIARVLNLPVATVKSHLHRARAKLRLSLESTIKEKDLGRLRNLVG